jgi:hypothetical protein
MYSIGMTERGQKLVQWYDDSLEGKMAADPLKNKKMLNKYIFTF